MKQYYRLDWGARLDAASRHGSTRPVGARYVERGRPGCSAVLASSTTVAAVPTILSIIKTLDLYAELAPPDGPA